MTTFREKAFVALLALGFLLAATAVVVVTAPARTGEDIYYEYKGAERIDLGVGHAAPPSTAYWLGGSALLAFLGASLLHRR